MDALKWPDTKYIFIETGGRVLLHADDVSKWRNRVFKQNIKRFHNMMWK